MTGITNPTGCRNSLVLGGVKNGQKYLGVVSMIRVSFEDNYVATGIDNILARRILREEWQENLSFEDGVKLLEKCMRLLLYHHRFAANMLQIAKITEEGVTVFQPYALKTTFCGFSAFTARLWGLKAHGQSANNVDHLC